MANQPPSFTPFDGTEMSRNPSQVAARGPTDSRVARDLQVYLDSSFLPANLRERLLRDSDGGKYYRRISSLTAVHAEPGESSYCVNQFGCLCCQTTTLVNAGNIATMTQRGQYHFLGEGFHAYCCCGVELGDPISLTTTNRAIRCGPLGFINISDGNIGVMLIGSEYKLLAPGSYEWNCATVSDVQVVPARGSSQAQLGPYTLVSVTDGFVAITYHHGVLTILGAPEHPGDVTVAPTVPPVGGPPSARKGPLGKQQQARAAAEPSRMFFLDDPNWVFKGFLSLQMNTDRLEDNDLMSKDNVEIIMVAMSQWRIVNPHLAVTHCAPDMKGISSDVNQLVRATIARIVANTNIGAGPVAAGVTQPTVMAVPLGPDGAPMPQKKDDDSDLAHMMQSRLATQFMAELQRTMDTLGVEVLGVYVPEKRIKNDDTRQQVASQAIIGIQAQAQRAAAEASAYATVKAADAEAQSTRVRADATAYTTVTVAKADAQAIKEVAAAHAAAGVQLGKPSDTAARLALTDRTAKAMEGAKVTIFSGGPSNMAYMLNGDSASAGSRQ